MKRKSSNRVVTTEIRLKKGAVTEELEGRLKDYGRLYRYAYRELSSSDFYEKHKTLSKFRTHLSERFEVLTREANSVIREIQGRLEAVREVKVYEKEQLELRLKKFKDKAGRLEKSVDKLKEKCRENRITPKALESLRRKKHQLYHLKNKINRLDQKKSRLEDLIERGVFKVGHGGKRAFKKQFDLEKNGFSSHQEWYEYYCDRRDHQIFFLGCADEGAGNQLARFYINYENGTLTFRLRREKNCAKNERYLFAYNIRLSYLKDEVYSIIKGEYKTPISLRFLKRGKKYYIQLIFEKKEVPVETTSFYGTVGLDYNEGFIQQAETDEAGNLVGLRRYDLRHHGTGKKAQNEIRNIAKEIAEEALTKGKDVIIEDLDFRKKKADAVKGGSERTKRENRRLHRFDYSRYKEVLERACTFRGVTLKKVAPFYSSVNGALKYNYQKKLNTHQSASLVIARRGQGFRD